MNALRHVVHAWRIADPRALTVEHLDRCHILQLRLDSDVVRILEVRRRVRLNASFRRHRRRRVVAVMVLIARSFSRPPFGGDRPIEQRLRPCPFLRLNRYGRLVAAGPLVGHRPISRLDGDRRPSGPGA